MLGSREERMTVLMLLAPVVVSMRALSLADARVRLQTTRDALRVEK
jgi:hypothetical protein